MGSQQAIDSLPVAPTIAEAMTHRSPVPLARISHQLSTAAADPGMSTALRSVGRLDVLSSTPAAPSGRAPCIHAHLHRLATKSGEKSGSAPSRRAFFRKIVVSGYATDRRAELIIISLINQIHVVRRF
jgi:hypothetical protein